jgi:hypothetical protein
LDIEDHKTEAEPVSAVACKKLCRSQRRRRVVQRREDSGAHQAGREAARPFGPACALNRRGAGLSNDDMGRSRFAPEALQHYLLLLHGRASNIFGAGSGSAIWSARVISSCSKSRPPFVAFRGLVMAKPVWYPTLEGSLRRRLLQFILNVLKEERFEPSRANAYLQA